MASEMLFLVLIKVREASAADVAVPVNAICRSLRLAIVLITPYGKLLLARGPFSLEDERQLRLEYQIDIIVSKNSGGDATYAKIVAARELGIPVVMVQRPQILDVDQVANVEEAISWLIQQMSYLK